MADTSIKDEKRKRILSATLEACMKYGISEVTTRQISEIAEIGKSTIYEYFKDKDELINEAFSQFMQEMAEGRKSIREITVEDPVLALSTYIDNTIELALNDPDKLLLLSQYTMGIFFKAAKAQNIKEEYRKRVFPSMKSLVDEFGNIIEMGIEKGVMKPSADIDADRLGYTVLALVREIQVQAFIQDGTELKEVCEGIKETIFKILGIE